MGFLVTQNPINTHFRTQIGKLGMNLARAFLNLERVISPVSKSWKTNKAPKIHGPDCKYRRCVTASAKSECGDDGRRDYIFNKVITSSSSTTTRVRATQICKANNNVSCWGPTAESGAFEFVDPQAKRGTKMYVIYCRRDGKYVRACCSREQNRWCTFAEKGAAAALHFTFIYTQTKSSVCAAWLYLRAA